MSNSQLVNFIRLSPNYTKMTNKVVKKITIHHVAGKCTVEALGDIFAKTSRQASSNYGIGYDGRIGLYVPEDQRAWTSGSYDNDSQAVTIEVSNDGGAPDWHVSDASMQALIKLCVDICKRNGIKKLNYTGDKTGNLTEHNYFQATACPGPYLKSKLKWIAEEVNKQLGSTTTAVNNSSTTNNKKVLYRVQVGAYSKKENAEAMVKKLRAAGYKDAFITQVQV